MTTTTDLRAKIEQLEADAKEASNRYLRLAADFDKKSWIQDVAAFRRFLRNNSTGSDDEELLSPYVSDDELDLGRWAHDAAVLAIPTQFFCRPDCAGLCPVCGKDLNVEPHEHEETPPDSRWAALEALRADDAS